MKNIVFVCHGNICRSVMAEYIMKYLAKKNNLDLNITSKATSYEEIGNDIYPPAKRVLTKNGIPFERHYAARITKSEYDAADLVIVMDSENYYGLSRIVGVMSKTHYLKEYSIGYGEISDPWYTGLFDEVYQEIYDGCLGLIEKLKWEMFCISFIFPTKSHNLWASEKIIVLFLK